ncbi:MAG TPA: GNAT family N-acetyltransferase [Povalibacter sp.]|jgi:putative acetyltransferase
MTPEIRTAALDQPEVLELIRALNAELDVRYPEEGANHFRLDPDEVAPGRGVFLVAYAQGVAVGCGATRLNDPHTAEIKRMYVLPAYRGRGIAGAVLTALEAHAKTLGAKHLVLESGERQPESLAVYRRAGFREIERFGEYVDSPLSLCMGKAVV